MVAEMIIYLLLRSVGLKKGVKFMYFKLLNRVNTSL